MSDWIEMFANVAKETYKYARMVTAISVEKGCRRR